MKILASLLITLATTSSAFAASCEFEGADAEKARQAAIAINGFNAGNAVISDVSTICADNCDNFRVVGPGRFGESSHRTFRVQIRNTENAVNTWSVDVDDQTCRISSLKLLSR